ncbi:MAG: dockerin type I domain-containing protein, partial [Aureliella sp.]
MRFAALTRRRLLANRRRRGGRKPGLEILEPRRVRASLPYGALPNDTGEFMLGRIAVTPVLLESNGQIDPSTENWNKAHIDEVLSNLDQGLEWWQKLLAKQTTVHSLDWVVDRTYADQPVPTAYEPINRVSNDYALWTQEFLTRIGFNKSSSLEQNMRAFNDAQRQKQHADWAFTIFVVDSQQEGDGTFAQGGSFSRAFAFAGGLFFVTPSTRPASTFAHETGHMFWARDEYAGGGSYFLQRGYYATENSNAIDNNPDPNFQQAPSIMSAGAALDTAWQDVVSPANTLAMLGWQDSDGDGIFDVLDVPLLLDGVGRIDVTTGNYHFVGKAKAQTLPNRNPAGQGNDITLNKVSRIEARIGAGAWQTILQPDAYEAPLDLSIPLAGQTGGTIQLRAVDAATGITSNIFEGQIGAQPDATPLTGINGFVWNDANANGLFDAIESGLGAQQVRLVDQDGKPLNLQRAIEPDTQVPGTIPGTAYPGALLSAVGPDSNGNLGVFNDPAATTGSKVFRPYSV